MVEPSPLRDTTVMMRHSEARRLLLIVLACALSLPATASFINYSSREINCKIVYYGPSTAGLAENLQYIYAKTSPEAKGKLISLATETERTLFFDFLPLSLGEIRGFKTRFHLYTVPGQIFYDASRKLILKGVDGVVFVADADPAQAAATLESWQGLQRNLAEQGDDFKRVPLVVQLDQLHSAKPMSEADLRKLLGLTDRPVFVANSATGVGVFDTLKAIAKQILIALRDGAAASAPAVALPADSPATPGVANATPVRPRRERKPCAAYLPNADGSCKLDRNRALAAIRSSPFAAHKLWLAQQLQPTIWLATAPTSLDRIGVGESRLAGVPDLPRDFTWPRYRGEPLPLLAQLRLSDVAVHDAAKLLPRSGWLTVFCEVDEQDWTADPGQRDGCRVRYFDAKPEQLARTPEPPRTTKRSSELAPQRVRFVPGFSLPDAGDEVNRWPFEPAGDSGYEEFDDLAADLSNQPQPATGLHHLLGHPQHVQGEMRFACQQQYAAATKIRQSEAERDRAARDWVLLLQIDSDEQAGWMWGDVGVVYFWIRAADLKARAFDQVCVVMQCG